MIPGLGRSPGEGEGYPLQRSGLENSMDSVIHGVAESRTRLTFTFTSWLIDSNVALASGVAHRDSLINMLFFRFFSL